MAWKMGSAMSPLLMRDCMASKPPCAERFPVFSYGSNSVAQLKGRLLDDSLQGYPSFMPGMQLTFEGPNKGWARADGCKSCGTATLEKRPEKVALGTVVYLTESQLSQLDKFEGVPKVYQRSEGDAFVRQREGSWRQVAVLYYVKINGAGYAMPTEAYRCALLRNLRGSFQDTASVHVPHSQDEWRHPGYDRLSIPAFLFEVGVRMLPPWTMPAAISEQIAQIQLHLGRPPKTLLDVVECFQARAETRAEAEVARRLLISPSSCEDEGGHHDVRSTRGEVWQVWQQCQDGTASSGLPSFARAAGRPSRPAH